jgi:hypothetical protein
MMPADRSKSQLHRLRALAAAERERASMKRDDPAAALMHEGAAAAYERWADEIEKTIATVEHIDRADAQLRAQLTALGLAVPETTSDACPPSPEEHQSIKDEI